MSQPRFHIRTMMVLVATVAILLAAVAVVRSRRGGHHYYHANRAAVCRRLERYCIQQAASARKAADEARGDHSAGKAERCLEEARTWEARAREVSRDAEDALRESRGAGYDPSELPAHILRELKPGDLDL